MQSRGRCSAGDFVAFFIYFYFRPCCLSWDVHTRSYKSQVVVEIVVIVAGGRLWRTRRRPGPASGNTGLRGLVRDVGVGRETDAGKGREGTKTYQCALNDKNHGQSTIS